MVENRVNMFPFSPMMETFFLKVRMKCKSCNAFMNPIWETCLVWEKRISEDIDQTRAKELYKKRGWVGIYSSLLDSKIYLVWDDKVKVPDSRIPRYAQSALDDLRGLSIDELKMMHEAKKAFGGIILMGKVNS